MSIDISNNMKHCFCNIIYNFCLIRKLITLVNVNIYNFYFSNSTEYSGFKIFQVFIKERKDNFEILNNYITISN